MYDFPKQIEKLQTEGFIEEKDNVLVIHGNIWCGFNEGEIYGFFDVNFKRSGSKATLRLSLLDILEWFQFSSGEMKITIEKVGG